MRAGSSAVAPLPYLSVVATARNDNHGGDLLYRMQIFADTLVSECERHQIDAELIVVEWNPPPDRPRLADAIRWPRSAACPIRFIEVPPELHARLEHSDRLPLYQMIAKNVGIRRARGEFVLATNVDVILSDELMAVLAERKLDADAMYRCDRYDVTADIPVDASLDEQLRLCQERVIRISRREGTVDLRDGQFYRIYGEDRVAPWPIALMQHGAQHLLLKLRAYAWVLRGRPHHLPVLVRRILARRGASAGTPRRDPRHGPKTRWGILRHYRARYERLHRQWEWERARMHLHTNASGDFTLMSKEGWERAGGYRELEMYSMHIDGLVLFQGYYAGLRERCLPQPIYHLEHEAGFKPDKRGAAALNERLERAAIPQITNEQYMEFVAAMYRERRPITGNRPTWGFADFVLPETTLDGAPAAPNSVFEPA